MAQIESHSRVLHQEDESRNVSAIPVLSALILSVVLLVSFGIVMLYSASYGVAGVQYFTKQVMWVGVGLAGSLAILAIGYRNLAKMSFWLLVLCLVALLAARFCFEPVKGAYRWIRFASFSIQPSEFMKVVLALYVSNFCAENIRSFNTFKWDGGIIKLGAVIACGCGGVLLGKDLGTTILIMLTSVATMFAAGLAFRYLIVPLLLGVFAGFYIAFFDAERLSRVTSFLNPELVTDGSGYQLMLSKMALGSGGWFGVGFLKSRLKAKYLPEHHTDFILAIVGEEFGFAAIIGIMIFYAVFAVSGFKIAMHARDKLGMFLGVALTCGIFFQALINLAVVSGSAPTKGMSAPFISYGGSNMLSCLFATAIIISIALDIIFPDYNETIKNCILRKKV